MKDGKTKNHEKIEREKEKRAGRREKGRRKEGSHPCGLGTMGHAQYDVG